MKSTLKMFRNRSFFFLRKLKFLDYILILIVLLTGAIIFKFLTQKEEWISLTVYVPNASIFQANSIYVNDFEKNSFGKKIAEVSDFQMYNSANESNQNTSNKNMFIDVKILAKVNPRSGELEYKNKIIKIGSPIQLNFTSSIFSGSISQIGSSKLAVQTESRIITLRMYDDWPWIADSLKIGDAKIDEKGNKILEIISKDIKPAEITTTNTNGDTFIKLDPRKVDITLKIKILLQRFGDNLIYRKDTAVYIGKSFSLDIGNTYIENAYITDIK